MKTITIADILPGLYRRMLPAVCRRPIPAETLATCDHCIMLKGDDAAENDHRFFYDARTKCCTYQPVMPNYMIGAVLSDDSGRLGDGCRRVTDRIHKGVGVQPAGVRPSTRWTRLYEMGAQEGFGHSHSLLCGYFDSGSGNCTIWPYRGAICSTWFCKCEKGQMGKKFWSAVGGYLVHVEKVLSRHAMASLGVSPEIILRSTSQQKPQTEAARHRLSLAELDEIPDPEHDRRSVWGEWRGREEEFYRKAHQAVRDLTAADLERLGGGLYQVHVANLERRLAGMLDPTVPQLLQRNPAIRVWPLRGGRYRVAVHGQPFEIEGLVYRILDVFDGATATDRAKQLVAERFQADIDDDLLLALYHNQLLIKPGETTG